MSSIASKKAIWSTTVLALAVSCTAAQAETEVTAEVWVDNWFALYINEELVKEDSVAFKTERSFNAESFTFSTELPVQAAVIMKDYYENDTGLEYIGDRGQQIGDGGFIAQFKDASTGELIDVSNSDWQCHAIHQAPLNPRCELSNNPSAECESNITEAPANWMSAGFDDSSWESATVYSTREVSPKRDYRRIDWSNEAEFVWSGDLAIDNVVLCRFTLGDG